MIRNLHPLLRIAWAASGRDIPPATEEDIAELLDAYPNPPSDYLDIVRQYNLLYLDTQPRNNPYFGISLHSPGDVVDWPKWYPWVKETMPGAFFFGMDGDMIFLVGSSGGREGVFKVETSAADWTEAEYLAPTIRALLCDGVGWADKGKTV